MGRPHGITGWLAAAATIALLAGCGGDGPEEGATAAPTPAVPTGPQSLSIGVGGAVPKHPERDLLAFYPSAFSAHPGDTLRLVNPTQATPHTVTFGILPDRSNQPPLITPGVGFTPIAAAPCATASPVGPTTTTCPGAKAAPPPAASGPPPEQVTLPAFSGQPFYNSGLFLGGQTAVVPLSTSLKPGAYHFVCMLHPTMVATVTVVAPGHPVQSAGALVAAAARQVTADIADAAKVAASVPTPPARTVQAGAVGTELTVNQFFPGSTTISPGQTVTWTDTGYEPHLVVFGRQITEDDPLVFGAATPASGSSYGGGLAVSGLIGEKPFASTTYALTFPTRGTYPYACPIHPGMAGVVLVQ